MPRLIFEKHWYGHYSIWLIVKRWRPWYGRINERFAVASHWIEFGILDREFAAKFVRWKNVGL